MTLVSLGVIATVGVFVYSITLTGYTQYVDTIEFASTCPKKTVMFFETMNFFTLLAAIPSSFMMIFQYASWVSLIIMPIALVILTIVGGPIFALDFCEPRVQQGIKMSLILLGIIAAIFVFQAVFSKLFNCSKERVQAINEKRRNYVDNMLLNSQRGDLNRDAVEMPNMSGGIRNLFQTKNTVDSTPQSEHQQQPYYEYASSKQEQVISPQYYVQGLTYPSHSYKPQTYNIPVTEQQAPSNW